MGYQHYSKTLFSRIYHVIERGRDFCKDCIYVFSGFFYKPCLYFFVIT